MYIIITIVFLSFLLLIENEVRNYEIVSNFEFTNTFVWGSVVHIITISGHGGGQTTTEQGSVCVWCDFF